VSGRILIVEDEAVLRETLAYNLTKQGYRVESARDGKSALDIARGNHFDLVLLDIMLPVIDGLEVCRILRQETTVPILILTARDDEIDRVLGLEIGADDYLTKPFSMRELVARINAALRRSTGPQVDAAVFDNGSLRIDPSTFRVQYKGQPVRMTRKEFALLSELARNQGRVLTRETLLDRVWGLNYYGDSRTLDVHIRRLRQKLSEPRLIETVTGIGYRLCDVANDS
jgi:DNA-binding response OmpR family regulator